MPSNSTTTASLEPSRHLWGTFPSSQSCPSRATIYRDPFPKELGATHNTGSFSSLSTTSQDCYHLHCTICHLYAAVNNLHGHLPEDLGRSLPKVQLFGLSGNRLTGTIPMSLTNLSSLQTFDISGNEFTGVVPSALGKLKYLQWFSLDANLLHANNEQEWGFLTSLTNCSRLQVLSIGWNRLAGKLPSSVANLSTSIQLLRIHRNNIAGVIPSGIGNLIGLQQLILGENLLTGVIPVSIGKLTRMLKLYLGLNNFSGTIPSSIGNLSDLFALGINSNNMEGSIPPSFGNLRKLIALDISSNHLRGSIPNEIMNLTSISAYLVLSNNLLDSIRNPPNGWQFISRKHSSNFQEYEGACCTELDGQ